MPNERDVIAALSRRALQPRPDPLDVQRDSVERLVARNQAPAPEKDQVKLCGDCEVPEPSDEPTIGGDAEQPDDSSDGEDYSGL